MKNKKTIVDLRDEALGEFMTLARKINLPHELSMVHFDVIWVLFSIQQAECEHESKSDNRAHKQSGPPRCKKCGLRLE